MAECPEKGQVCAVSYNEAYRSTMMDSHTHEYYEISLILTGNVRSLLRHRAQDGSQSRLVLIPPGAPHWMQMSEPSFYSRINLCFFGNAVEHYVPEWKELVGLFGKDGNILLLTDRQREFFRHQLTAIQEEKNLFRQRLGILEFLSHVADMAPDTPDACSESPPPYILEALAYIDRNYPQKILAEDLAWHLGIGRTTLMTAFHKHTGSTLSRYITHVRVLAAIRLLGQNICQERVAEQVGLGNGGGLIRAFRQCYGMTPGQYMKQIHSSRNLKGE